jgi:hypothetical protein
VSPTAPSAATGKLTTPGSIGFLTVLQEACGFIGGYLVTNEWGRPLEFRLSSAVQPNRVQQVLYGPTLAAYVCAELIGKTLVDRAGVQVQLIVTDREAVLELRRKMEVPVVYLAPAGDARGSALAADGAAVLAAGEDRGPVLCHPHFLSDVPLARELLNHTEELDLAEPFTRIREAIGEARKMGVR